MKNEKGITLIALVITIIVLLILAGISIAMLTGDNGLLTKSRESASASAVAGAKDEVSLAFQELMAAYLQTKYTPGGDADAPTAGAIITKASKSQTAVTTATIHGCTVSATSADATKITIVHPSGTTTSGTGSSKSVYWSTGTLSNNGLTLTWTDLANE